jgi:putative flippase GtrA
VRETGSYIFFGGLTTLVDLVVFFCLDSLLHVNDKLAQAVSIAASIVFAFIVNKLFVFESRDKSRNTVAAEFAKFVAGRAVTFVIQFFGYIALEYVFRSKYLAKILIMVIVLVLNYIFSKLFVFTKKKADAPPVSEDSEDAP